MRLRDKAGVTGVEYAMLLSLIAAVVIVPVISTGASLQQIFCNMGGAIGGAACADASAAATSPPGTSPLIFPTGNTVEEQPGPTANILANADEAYGFVFTPNNSLYFGNNGMDTYQYSSDGTASVVAFSSASGAPWGAITPDPAALANMETACENGTAPIQGYNAGPTGGVPVVTTIGGTSQQELSALGDNPDEDVSTAPAPYSSETPAPVFAPTSQVLTCYAPS
jgi:Flp/Fap pilin component.